MASPAVVYFAGIGTVVTALGIGFGSALMLVSTQPVQKEQPAAFAKREVIAVEQAPVVAAAPAAQRPEPADPLAGLGPPVTALPIPKADDVSKALMQSPPPAVAAPAPAPVQTTATGPAPARTSPPGETAPVQAQKPAPPPAAPSASKDQPNPGIVAPERKSERRTADRKPVVMADKQPATVEVEESEDGAPSAAPAAPPTAPQSERPLRSGF
jgi:hypothetical protein